MPQLTESCKPFEPEIAAGPVSTPGYPPLGRSLKVLLVWPRFPPSFWSFEGIMELIPSEANHPPLGLLTVGALCPKDWTLKLIDRSFQDLLDADILWEIGRASCRE